MLGGVPVPPGDEARHMLLAGKSGSGKTTALRALVRQIDRRGKHALLSDANGSYVRFFYRAERGDIILSHPQSVGRALGALESTSRRARHRRRTAHRGRAHRHLADRHVRPGWVWTIHSSQGAASDRVMAHLEAFRANIVDARAVYVAISRARKLATLYTDSRADLTEALGIRDGALISAIDETMKEPKGATIATPAPVRAAGVAIG